MEQADDRLGGLHPPDPGVERPIHQPKKANGDEGGQKDGERRCLGGSQGVCQLAYWCNYHCDAATAFQVERTAEIGGEEEPNRGAEEDDGYGFIGELIIFL